MWNILKTADRRVKETKIWDSGYYSAHRQGTFDARFFEFGLGSFSALYKISNFTNFLKLCPSPNFHPIHPNFIQGIIIILGVTFLVICQELQKIWHIEILTQDNRQLEISISPTIFIGIHLNFVTKLATMVNLNACQNAAMRSWCLVPEITCVLGLQFKQIFKAPGPLVSPAIYLLDVPQCSITQTC